MSDSEIVRPKRQQKLTDIGLEYRKKVKHDTLKQTLRRVMNNLKCVNELISEGADYEVVRTEYSNFLLVFEELFCDEEEYFRVANEKEREEFNEKTKSKRNELMVLKAQAESYIEREARQLVLNSSRVSPQDSVSQTKSSVFHTKSSRTTSKSFQVNSMTGARIKADQRKAEVKAKIDTLQKLQDLEISKMKLKMEEERLYLEREMAIAEARTKVLEDLETSTVASSRSERKRRSLGKSSDTDNTSSHHTQLQQEKKKTVLAGSAGKEKVKKEVGARSYMNEVDCRQTANERLQYSQSSFRRHTSTDQEPVYNQDMYNQYRLEDRDRYFEEERPHFQDGYDRDALNNMNRGTKPQYTEFDPHVDMFQPRQCDTAEIPRPRQTPTPQPTSPEAAITSVVNQLRKPVPEIVKFSGNPLEYKKFIRQFKTKVVVYAEDTDETMNYLEQFTTGEAHKIVSSYSYLDSRRGFEAAMRELESRYGDTETIASAFVKRALDWNPIKNDSVKALDEFSIFLTECLNAVESIEAMRVLEYPDNIKKLVMKLPYYYHDKWRGYVDRRRSERQLIRFHHLVDFVKLEARKANDPIYGKLALRTEHKPMPKTKYPALKDKQVSFATDLPTKPSQPENPQHLRPKAFLSPCICCQSNQHGVETCDQWRSRQHFAKINILRNKGLCFRCLRHGHVSKFCPQTEAAQCKICKGQHLTILHMDKKDERIDKQDKNITRQGGDNKSPVSACAELHMQEDETGAGDVQCTMAIVPVRVSYKDSSKYVETYAFLDPGSSACFCTETLMTKLGCESKKKTISLKTMGKPHTMTTFEINGLKVCDLEMKSTIKLPKVYTKDKLPVSRNHVPRQDDVTKWPHLSDIDLCEKKMEIGLLIGNNVPSAYTPLEVRTGPINAPHATKTILGWIVWNLLRDTVNGADDKHYANRIDVTVPEEEELKTIDRMLRDSMNYDFPERTIDDKKEHSQEDLMFLSKVSQSLGSEEGHYTIGLPFRNDNVKMPNNSNQALQRLGHLKSKMKKNADFHSDYTEFMNKIINKGYAEQIPNSELHKGKGQEWYIPHHGVYHPQKQKIRVVFDCSAQYQGVSLNNQLLQGPDLTNSLLGILLRFREERVAIIGDIEAMYYQVKVPKSDQDFLRFFWWPGGDLSKNPVIYRMTVHLFGAISSPTCANIALRQTASDNEHSFPLEVTNLIEKNFYVDDFLKSTPTDEKAKELIQEVSKLCSSGGFHLTKWISNSHSVMDSVPNKERAKGAMDLNLDQDQLPAERALGVHWNVEEDTIRFDVNIKPKPETRRGILSTASSIFDPLGLLAPFTLTARILLQILCRLKISWDDDIGDKMKKKWQAWIEDLKLVSELDIQRCYKPPDFGEVSTCDLHMFSDASDAGYGVAAYICITNCQNKVHCTLVLGKSRVVPLKKITIPRLELTAAVLSVHLSKVLTRELEYPLRKIYFWTDSMSVIRYISNETTRFHTFVANRVALIREGTDVDQWNYIDSKSNPADIASRGIKMRKLIDSSLWWNGPEILQTPVKTETQDQDDLKLDNDDPEVKCHISSTVTQTCDVMDKLFLYFSDWMKLKRSVAWILAVKEELARRVKIRKENTEFQDMNKRQIDRRTQELKIAKSEKELSNRMIEEAEMSIIRYIQSQHYAAEICDLQQKENSRQIKHYSSLRKLDPILAQGILRVGGRLNKSELSYDAKHPIILHKSSTITELILRDIHKKVGHLGKNSMLSELRQKFWIVGAGNAIKRIVSKCVTCKKYKAQTLNQKMGDLPQRRLTTNEPPFTNTGMDFFGPLLVKRGRACVKRYGVVFTCLAVRAVHLEVAHSLDTDSCINAIRRFTARRGNVKSICSDNGTNLVGSCKELKCEIQKWNQHKIGKELQQNHIEWHFNPPSASHFGGIWERLIRSVRKILYSLMQEQTIRLDDEGLQTLFCEIEAILNNRPITELSSDPNDLTPLTPNHLLLLRPGENFSPGIFTKDDNYARRRWKQIQYLSDIFWKRWQKEYIVLLNQRQKWCFPKRNVQIGDVVLVVDNTPRNSWAMARVLDVMTDCRGLVRAVRVKTQSSEYVRPVHKLCLLLEND